MRLCSDDEGRDLYRKRGSEFKLPYPIIDIDPTEFEAGLLPPVDPGAFDVHSKPLATSAANTGSKKAAKSRPENRKRKSQANRDQTTGVIAGSHIVRGCPVTPSLVNHLKSEILTSPGSVRTGSVAGGFEAEFYRGPGYHPVIAATESALQCAIDSSRYYLDQYCAPTNAGAGDQFASNSDAMCGDLAASRYAASKVGDLYPAMGSGGSCATGTRYHPEGGWFDTNIRPPGTGVPAAADWAVAMGGLLDPAAWLGPSTCWYKPQTAMTGHGISSSSHLASLYDRHQSAATATSLSNYYCNRRQQQQQSHEGLDDQQRRGPTAASSDYPSVCGAVKSIDSNGYDIPSSTISTAAIPAAVKSLTTNISYPIYDSRLPTPPDDEAQPQLSYSRVPSSSSPATDDACRQKSASTWNREEAGNATATTGCSFGVATPVIQLTAKSR